MCEKSFRWRINDLYRETELSILEFAEKCDISRQSMQYYLQGKRMPDSSGLLKICQACSVSADWLLGLSDVRQPSSDMRAVCEYTGLSEEAVTKIRCPEVDNPFGKTLSRIIEAEEFANLITTYKIYLELVSNLNALDLDQHTSFQLNDQGTVTLDVVEAIHHFKQKTSLAMTHICEDEYLKKLESVSVQKQYSIMRAKPEDIEKQIKRHKEEIQDLEELKEILSEGKE